MSHERAYLISEVNTYDERIKIKDQKIDLLKDKKLIYGREIQFLRNQNKQFAEKIQNLEEFFKKEEEGEEGEQEESGTEDVRKEYDRVKLGLVRDPEFKFETRKGEPVTKSELKEIKESDVDMDFSIGVSFIR